MIFYIGNITSKNGPSNVDISLLSELKEKVYFIQADTKKVTLKDIFKFFKSSTIQISAVSFMGILFALFGRLLCKKVCFTMHGTLVIERNFRRISSLRIIQEKLLVLFCSQVIAVSNTLKSKLENIYKINESKIIAIPNGIDLVEIVKVGKRNNIICIGGGRPEKRILDICKAVDNLPSSIKKDLTLKVFGEDGKDSNKIKQFNFVEYEGFVSHEELLHEMNTSRLFVQFSSYEPFCLSLFDAINANCNIIVSSEIGALDYLTPEDLTTISIVQETTGLAGAFMRQGEIESPIYSNYNHMSWNEISKLYLNIWNEK